MKSIETVGILGLGKMGCPIAVRIAGARGVDAVRQARLLWRSFPQTARSGARGSAANRFRIGGDMGTYSNLSWQLLVQFLIVLFLVVAVSGLVVGVGLIASSPKIVEYFHVLNRWVSTRHVLRPVEVPVDTERATHRHYRWLAGGFVLGGLISIFGLLAGLDASAVGAAFAEKRFAPVVAIAVESTKWVLIVG